VKRLCCLVLALGCGSGAAPRRPQQPPDDEPDAAVIVRDAGALEPDASAPDVELVDDRDASTDVVVTYPRHPSCTTAPPPVMNGDFELPGAGVPGWQLELTGAATAQTDPISGFAGTGGLVVRVPDDGVPGGAVLRQSLTLAPFTGYTVRARIGSGNMRPRGEGRFLVQVLVRNGERTYAIGPLKQDRTDLDYGTYSSEFPTGADGHVELEIRTFATGQFLLDQISVDCSERSQRFMGKDLVLGAYDSHVQAATPPNLEKVVGDLEKALGSFATLTGQTVAKPSVFPSLAAVTEPRGNPSFFSDVVSATAWSLPGYVPPTMMSGLARNFDRPAWLFDDDFSGFTIYFAAETGGLTWGDESLRGRNARRPYETAYNADWKMGGCPSGAGLVWKNILVRDLIGWEPFQQAFRYFSALPAAQVPATRWERLQRWNDKLAELSGKDVWSVYTPLDRTVMMSRYAPPALPATRALATLPATTTTVPLVTVDWESAIARERPSRNRLPNDCPLMTAEGPVETGLHAYPYSQYVYRLGKRWKRLVTGYALRGSATSSVVFLIRGDGRELLRMLVADGMTHSADLDVSTVDRLELVVTDAGTGTFLGPALWANPRLTR
jgi:hypothetical protein